MIRIQPQATWFNGLVMNLHCQLLESNIYIFYLYKSVFHKGRRENQIGRYGETVTESVVEYLK